jgi:palmitoyltransferase ZDHHC13/17
MAQHSAPGTPAPNNAVAPAQPPSKSGTATPKLNNEVELGQLPVDEVKNDIMQMARIGDIPAMEKLFESGDYDATYTDDEGITPLHVRLSGWLAVADSRGRRRGL